MLRTGEIITCGDIEFIQLNMTDPWKFNHMNIILGTGEWDNTRHESVRLSAILHEKGIRHWLDDRRWCGHDWNYWRDMLPYYLSTI